MENMFIGIDISKDKFDVCVNESSKIKTFENNKKVINNFINTNKAGINKLHVVVETIGGYDK